MLIYVQHLLTISRTTQHDFISYHTLHVNISYISQWHDNISYQHDIPFHTTWWYLVTHSMTLSHTTHFMLIYHTFHIMTWQYLTPTCYITPYMMISHSTQHDFIWYHTLHDNILYISHNDMTIFHTNMRYHTIHNTTDMPWQYFTTHNMTIFHILHHAYYKSICHFQVFLIQIIP